MADEDEVDILGDFSLPLDVNSDLLDKTALVSQNSDLLKCDYTIHPQWLLDKPSANPDNWYNLEATTPDLSDSESMAQVFTENCITDESGWTEKEKNLLQRGLEIFGRSSIRLAQFVGSKSSAEVRYYLKNFYAGSLTDYHTADNSGEDISGLRGSEVLNSDQIPTSIEEVIAVVNAGSPTVGSSRPHHVRRESSSSSSSTTYERSTKATVPHRQPIGNIFASKGCFKGGLQPTQIRRRKRVKFKSKLRTPKNFTKISQTAKNNSPEVSREIITGRGLSVPIYEGEEIVKIENAEDDSSDVSIDIEDTESSNKSVVPEQDLKPVIEQIDSNPAPVKEETNLEITEQLDSLEEPREEFTLNKDMITDLEKHVHSDYFEGRSAKTPERYLKIRNHIVNSWHSSKPNYVYKTSMRLGLKNCGDVTCISRIHYFLEQIGAINFGCEQTKYERPLRRILQIPDFTKPKVRQAKSLTSREPTELGPRHRVRKKFNNDGDGGCTMTHDEKGYVIDTTIINEEPPKPRAYVKKPTIRLIYCRPFPAEKRQENVKISLSTLMLMDFHSHCYLTEVMGLVGGSWDVRKGTLTICCYEPCKNIASSSTHCDMCPISQAKAAENIHSRNFEILGWFHSHPTFAPEPSQQDLDTQRCVQQWIGHGKPCVGVILSPFSVNAALISSPFRCWFVDKKPNFEDQFVPYRYKVEVVAEDFFLPEFLSYMRSIVNRNHEGSPQDKHISFLKPYFQDLTMSHLDKFICSVNMHLAKCGSVPKSKCDAIIEGIKEVIQKG